MYRSMIAVSVCCLIAGCAPLVAGGGAALTLGTVATAAAAAAPVLSDVARLGCDVQSLANGLGAVGVSRSAGKICAW